MPLSTTTFSFLIALTVISAVQCRPIQREEDWNCMEQWLSRSGLSRQTALDRLTMTEVRKAMWGFRLDEANILEDYHRHLLRDPDQSAHTSALLEIAFSRVKKSNVSAMNLVNCIGGQHSNTKCSSHPPCKHGSRCLRSSPLFSFYCNCSPGFSGKDCSHELNGCESQPCKHGGTCLDTLGQYRCACRLGFEGPQCEKRWLDRNIFKSLSHKVTDLSVAVNSSLAEVDNKLKNVLEQVVPLMSTIKTQEEEIAKLYNVTKTLASLHSCHHVSCQNGGLCVNLKIGFACQCGPLFTGRFCESLNPRVNSSMVSCQAYYDNGLKRNGKYTIRIGNTTKQVWCDMKTETGGWIVIQRRRDGSVNFFRNWEDYKNGFGNLSGEFWLGNHWIHLLTSQGHHELRIDFNGGKYAKYSEFAIAGEKAKYHLTVSGFSGNAADRLSMHNTAPFSTKDRDNDNSNYNCAVVSSGAWWYRSCYHSNPNGLYGVTNSDKGISWQKGVFHPTFTEMKIR